MLRAYFKYSLAQANYFQPYLEQPSNITNLECILSICLLTTISYTYIYIIFKLFKEEMYNLNVIIIKNYTNKKILINLI